MESCFKNKLKFSYNKNYITKAFYRPFTQQYYYCDLKLSDLLTKTHFEIFGENLSKPNPSIWFKCGSDWSFFSLAIDKVHDILPQGGSKCLPLFRFYNGKQDNITDWALAEFQNHYDNKNITKENIFYYVYAVLHTPQYRVKYEQNLKREFPRIPYYKDFLFFVERGKQLADLHIGYEKIQPYPLETENISKNKHKTAEPMLFEEPITDLYGKAERTQYVPKAKLKANKDTGEIEIDDITILRGIPAEAWTYKLGNRSALEWILDQYKESKPTDKTIAEHFNTYRFADYKEEVMQLLKRVCRVSVETVRIVGELEHAKS